MSAKKPLYRHADGVLPNTLALSVVVLGYPASVLMLGLPAWWLSLTGALLLVLTLTWAAYFIHEFAHHAIFARPETNARWGVLMTWITGSCYARFEDLRRKHMRHHIERADVVTFDVHGFIQRAPAWFRSAVLALEWLYIPAVELLMHSFVVLRPFRAGGEAMERARMLAIVALRLAGFALMAWWSLKALALYALAYLVFLTLLRFADCFQHTYDAYPILDDAPIPNDKVRDRAYEQANTYSDIVGLKSPVLNMLWLNFGYHNAHHERPTEPWYRLPAYHRSLYATDYAQVIPAGELLRSFHRNRLRRIMATDYGVVEAPGTPRRADRFVGAVGVSFLTAV
ncbi:MAG: fatty acid desaturase family protein [Curvibacter sp.]|jgi:fatty acid desaturase|nr:fatty acid desaturase [Curvibacter sp.]